MIYVLVINRDRGYAVCAFPWNRSPKDLPDAIENPQLHFNSSITSQLNYEFYRGQLVFAQFTDEAAYRRGLKLIERGIPLGELQDLVKPIGYERGRITPAVVYSVKEEGRLGHSQRTIAENNGISLGSVNSILQSKYDHLQGEQGVSVPEPEPQIPRETGVQGDQK